MAKTNPPSRAAVLSSELAARFVPVVETSGAVAAGAPVTDTTGSSVTRAPSRHADEVCVRSTSEDLVELGASVGGVRQIHFGEVLRVWHDQSGRQVNSAGNRPEACLL